MARQLWLLRHAEAETHGTREDFQRRLTARGEHQARAAGMALSRLGAPFDAVLFSPKVRARRTAELAAEGWSGAQRAKLSEHAPLASGYDARQARERLAAIEAGGRLLLVGHEPDFSRIVGELTGARADIKKGGLAALRLGASRGELLVLMRPRELALLAGAPLAGE